MITFILPSVIRWGDQQWWPRPISMFGEGNLNKEIDHYDEINTDNEKYLVHKLWPRFRDITFLFIRGFLTLYLIADHFM